MQWRISEVEWKTFCTFCGAQYVQRIRIHEPLSARTQCGVCYFVMDTGVGFEYMAILRVLSEFVEMDDLKELSAWATDKNQSVLEKSKS